jgi:hypothetical protein
MGTQDNDKWTPKVGVCLWTLPGRHGEAEKTQNEAASFVAAAATTQTPRERRETHEIDTNTTTYVFLHSSWRRHIQPSVVK